MLRGRRGEPVARMRIGHRRDVARAPDVGEPLDPERRIHAEAAALVHRQAALARQRRRPNPGGPHEGLGRERLAVGEPDRPLLGGLQARVLAELDPALDEPRARVGGQVLVELREDPRSRLHHDPAHLVGAEGRDRAERRPRQVFELAEGLDPGEPGADDHEGHRRAPLGGIVELGGALQLGQDVVAEPGRLGELLEPHGVLGEPRDRQRPRPRARADDEAIPRERAVHAGGQANRRAVRGRVDRRDLPHHQPCASQRPAERDDDRPGIDQPAGDLGEERLVEHVALGVHQHDRVVGGQPPLQPARRVQPDVPAPDDEDRAHRGSEASASGSWVRSRIAASGTASCSGLGSSGASPRRTQTVRMPAAFAGSTS